MNVKRIRDVLNALFMLGTLATVIIYFAVDDWLLFAYVGMATMAIKFIEFTIRFTIRTK